MQKLASHSECCLKWPKGQCLIAVKRHHDHSKSYVGKHLIGADLLFQRVGYSIIVTAGSMAACRSHGAGEVAVSEFFIGFAGTKSWPGLSI